MSASSAVDNLQLRCDVVAKRLTVLEDQIHGQAHTVTKIKFKLSTDISALDQLRHERHMLLVKAKVGFNAYYV